jgi:hypothetical protein
MKVNWPLAGSISVIVGFFMLVIAGAVWLGESLHRAEMAMSEANRVYRDTNPDAVRCRQANGLPVFSAWDGRLIDCKPLPQAVSR